MDSLPPWSTAAEKRSVVYRLVYALEHKGDKRKPATAILARVHELVDSLLHIRRGSIADPFIVTRKNLGIAELGDLGSDLVNSSPEARGDTGVIDDDSGVSMEEYEDIPRQ